MIALTFKDSMYFLKLLKAPIIAIFCIFHLSRADHKNSIETNLHVISMLKKAINILKSTKLFI